MKRSRLLLLSLALLLTVGCHSPSPTIGIADRERLINQAVAKSENWRQIVRDSPFQLGAFTKGRYTVFFADYGTFPRIDGPTVCIPMGLEFTWQHLDLPDREAQSLVNFSTTADAYDNLIRRATVGYDFWIGEDRVMDGSRVLDLILVTEPSEAELRQAEDAGMELVVEPVCRDAFVFITHRDNPVDSLTVKQIRQIYSGKIKNWKAVGGPDQKITAYQREPNSGSQTTMEQRVMGGVPMLPPPMIAEIEFMSGLVERVAEYVNEEFSIGYTFQYYIDRLYINENIKVLAIEGVSPTVENMQNQTYPFTANYYAVYRAEDRDGLAGQFAAWILSDEGQQCVAQAGYCPLGG